MAQWDKLVAYATAMKAKSPYLEPNQQPTLRRSDSRSIPQLSTPVAPPLLEPHTREVLSSHVTETWLNTGAARFNCESSSHTFGRTFLQTALGVRIGSLPLSMDETRSSLPMGPPPKPSRPIHR